VHFIQHPNTIDSEGAGEVGCLWHIEIFECDLVSEDINNLRTSPPGFGIGLPNLIADNLGITALPRFYSGSGFRLSIV
jgi:hypothetical protein